MTWDTVQGHVVRTLTLIVYVLSVVDWVVHTHIRSWLESFLSGNMKMQKKNQMNVKKDF